jgi:SAM-dependent methyltransferase
MTDRSRTVAAVAFTLLALEILLARLYPVFLGSISAFIAIPVAMFGLGLGATYMHVRREDLQPRLLEKLVPALWFVTLASLLLGFLLFNDVFNLTHYKLQNPLRDMARTASLLLVFTPIFAVGGVVLSLCFRDGAAHVGRLYAFDLVGSAFACFAVPLALHFFDMPVVLVFVLAALGFAGVANLPQPRRRSARRGLGVALGALLLLAMFQLVFTERPDPEVLGVRYSGGRVAKELTHRWNEVSRVGLMQWTDHEGRQEHRVVHDDGISNVRLRTWRPERMNEQRRHAGTHGLPWLVGDPPRKALVVFAGAGRDMMLLYEHAGGDLEVTGIELNARVPWLVRDGWNLQTFWDLPGVDLRSDEGRAFLERSREQYDVIFVASNGAQYATRTGHSRKFLETREAMEAYLDRLAPGGVLVFDVQPLEQKLRWFKRIFAERGLGPLEDAVAVVSSRNKVTEINSLIVRPDGLTAEARRAIAERWPGKKGKGYVLFDPDGISNARVAEWVRSPDDPALRLPTDDRPYERPVSFRSFELLPSAKKLGRIQYALDWIKVFTLLLFATLAAVLVAILQGVPRGGRRLPLPLTGWFLVSGVAYMFAQVGLMAKLELFMGKPLYSISVVLAAFLLANGMGSALVERGENRGRPLPGWLPPVAAAVAVPGTLFVVDRVLPGAITWPLPVRILLALLAVAPLATVMGMFYPLGASRTVQRGLPQLVPMTFGLATLSSAVGSTAAMVLIINHGFRDVVLSAVPMYALLAVVGALALRPRPVSSAP